MSRVYLNSLNKSWVYLNSLNMSRVYLNSLNKSRVYLNSLNKSRVYLNSLNKSRVNLTHVSSLLHWYYPEMILLSNPNKKLNNQDLKISHYSALTSKITYSIVQITHFLRHFEECLSIVCLFVLMPDHNSRIPERICFKFWLGNSVEPREYSILYFQVLAELYR